MGSSIAEFSARAVLLGIILSVVLGAANVYLGLYAGLTVSASIPAAVISMGILRLFRRRATILENNMVQSIASAGESLAAGVIFTVPAIVLVGAWKDFAYWPTTLIAILGGLLGVVFMIPLRSAMIKKEKELVFPEGVACAEVLRAGQETGGRGLRFILLGLGLGIALKTATSLFKVLKGKVEWAFNLGDRLFYFGSDLSVALLAVGYIVRLKVAALVFAGGALGWLVVLPLLHQGGSYDLDAAYSTWKSHTRYIGVGAMFIAGIYSIFGARAGIFESLKLGKQAATGDDDEKDLGKMHLLVVFMFAVFGTFFLYDYLLGSAGISLLATVIMVGAAFIFVAVAAYVAGLVGSSNSPVSGMTIITLLIAAGIILALGIKSDSTALAILGVAGVVCCAVCTASDISQDLKTGLLVGATPRKQQMGEMIGIIAAAFVFAPVLGLLHQAYGIGTGAEGSLQAPQASLFAGLTQGLLGEGALPFDMIYIGAALGTLVAIADILAKKLAGFRLHPMAVAVGIYLPFSLSVPMLVGGLIAWGVSAAKDKTALAFSSGLIAGEALAGIGIALLVVSQLQPADHGFSSVLLSVTVFAAVAGVLFYSRK